MKRTATLLVLLFSNYIAWGQEAVFPAAPMLRIEAGNHTAPVWCIATDAAGRYIMTAAQDKTVRIWSGADGRLLNIFRPPIADGNVGQIYAGAISPDGRYAAIGGWMMPDGQRHVVYIFDRTTGALAGRLTGLGNVTQTLRFSPDGSLLAMSMGGTAGVRVYRVDGWELLWEDTAYNNNMVYGLDISPDGKLLVTASYDSYLRLYNLSSGGLLQKAQLRGGTKPYRAVFNKDGSQIAVAYDDNPRIEIFSTHTLKFVQATNVEGIAAHRHVGEITFSMRSGALWAAGTHTIQDEIGYRKQIISYPGGSYGSYKHYSLPVYGTIMHVAPHPAGGALYASADPAWGWVDETGTLRMQSDSPIADYRAQRENFTCSSDGAVVQFAYVFGAKDKAVFKLETQEVEVDAANFPAGMAFNPVEGMGLTNYRSTSNPLLNGAALAGLKDYETVRCAAGDVNSGRFVVGSSWYLRAYTSKGEVQWAVELPGECWSVNITADGRMAIAAYGDGTIRWHRMRDGQELLAFFPHQDRQRWVAWTPSGYYMARTGGENLIGWHINRGANQAADFYPASKFRDTYYRPDVVQRVLTTLSEAEALQQADAERGRASQPLTNLQDRVPPIVTILTPTQGQAISTAEVTVAFTVRSPADAPVVNVRPYIDGRPYQAPESTAGGQAPVFRGIKPSGNQDEIRLTVPPKDCVISLIAESKNGYSEPAFVQIKWAGGTQASGGGAPEGFLVKPKLYVLAIGVNDYVDNSSIQDLQYPAKDAKDVTAAFQAQAGKLYREVEVKTLTDAKATRDNILDALLWLEQNTTSLDVAVLFIAGHGITDNVGDFYYLPSDADLNNPRRSCIPNTEFIRTLQGIAGKVILFFDACHSGSLLASASRRSAQADVDRVVNELTSSENGAIAFQSSTGRQFSLESPEWGNGAFTKVLVEGLSGKADFNQSGRITVNMLALYLAEGVKKLTGGKQTPVVTIPPNVPDFPLAITR